MKGKLVFDSSAIISISEKCFMPIVKRIAESSQAGFFIAKTVFEEAVEYPIQVKRFELNAIRIKKAVDDGWLKVQGLDAEAQNLAKNIQATANSLFSIKKNHLKLLHEGEAETLVLAKSLGARMIVIDERTTRSLLEDPFRLKSHLSERYGEKIDFDEQRLKQLQGTLAGIEAVRSAELIALAFDKGLFGEELEQSRQALEAALFGVKFAGCAISGKEIEDYLQQLKG